MSRTILWETSFDPSVLQAGREATQPLPTKSCTSYYGAHSSERRLISAVPSSDRKTGKRLVHLGRGRTSSASGKYRFRRVVHVSQRPWFGYAGPSRVRPQGSESGSAGTAAASPFPAPGPLPCPQEPAEGHPEGAGSSGRLPRRAAGPGPRAALRFLGGRDAAAPCSAERGERRAGQPGAPLPPQPRAGPGRPPQAPAAGAARPSRARSEPPPGRARLRRFRCCSGSRGGGGGGVPQMARPEAAGLELRGCARAAGPRALLPRLLLLGVALGCSAPGPRGVQEQAYSAAVVLEGRVQALAGPGNGSAEAAAAAGPAGGLLVKVLDLWPLHSGGLRREQLIRVGAPPAPCFRAQRNRRYIFFLEPTEQPLVFAPAFAPLDAAAAAGKSLKKDVARILCADCPAPPKLKKLKSLSVEVGAKISLKCEASAGNPQPSYKWFKDGREVKKSKDVRIKYGNGKKNSRLQLNRVRVEDAGEYSCEAENVLGRDTVKGTISVKSVSTTLSSGPGHTRQCNETVKSYCVNGGVCYYIEGINQLSCRCPNEFTGDQCQNFAMASFSKHIGLELKEAEELYQKRVLTITGICVALLVVGIVCVVAYCKTKKQRNQMHNHLRQNMCPAHQNRNLANGPSHPRLDPEEIQMADYMSKNVPVTEHVIRRETETTFSGSHSCSPSHRCSTGTPTSSQRHGSHTWSMERTESLTSDCQSGIMLSSVGTSKCNSPACVEARARREATFCVEDQRGPMTQYRDSVDSLRDSPHSERYVSALTTPARLSPVDFHCSPSAHMPTFEITSPNSAHAASLPPAASISFQVEDQQPLLRRYQVPFQEMQRYDSYYQRSSYLNESTGSLPSSPFRITEDDEYETTQEYITALEHPKRIGSSNRRWRKSKLNGHLSHRGKMLRDSFSVSSASYSESDEELVAESTPFLSIRNMEAMDTDSPPLYRPAESRTYYSFDRCSTQGDSRLSHPTRSSQDSAPP
ncbi:pro-neuregulin-2, membrane-bound isoform [Eublepharis macularius]|uniref:Pro-neuregulin-2, membrane-bound isoform n=1 Tax=Eublepharis macularius TaxID=481883 RepID=A0AA97JKZ7_EUBMA|nr:pro-neuregulin-2, membrane-bound isoform [Eublepharis macularius]